jgi:PleD family two-component response regulator
MIEPDPAQCSILIVDDVAKNIQLIGNILGGEGYELAFATSGQKALEIASSGAFDLILLDIMMPGTDGYAVCRQLRSNGQTHDVRIIFLTAKTQGDDIVKGFECGAVDYITKPFNPAELVMRVRTHLALKKIQDLVAAKNLELEKMNQALETLNGELKDAISEIKTLQGLLPICSNCKKIREADADPKRPESWVPFEVYMNHHTEATFTHGICPECVKKLYPEIDSP